MAEPYGDGAIDIGIPKHIRVRFGSFIEATPVKYLDFLIAMAKEKQSKEGSNECRGHAQADSSRAD